MSKLGVSLLSFSPDYLARGRSTRSILETVATLGLPQHVELVAGQHLRGFPRSTPQAEREFLTALDAFGLSPSCICGFTDLARRRSRPLSTEEVREECRAQLAAAARLHFPVLRLQHAPVELLAALLAEAEAAGVCLVVEVNSPHRLGGAELEALLGLFERAQSPSLGFLADLGTTASRLSDGMRRAYAAKGVPAEAIDLVWDTWRTAPGDPLTVLAALQERLGAAGYGQAALRLAAHAMVLFGREDPADWAPLLPHVRHVHVKAFDVDEDGVERCIDYPRLVPMLDEAGFDGVLSWEYEGWLFAAASPTLPFDGPPPAAAIAAHQDHVRRLLAGSA